MKSAGSKSQGCYLNSCAAFALRCSCKGISEISFLTTPKRIENLICFAMEKQTNCLNWKQRVGTHFSIKKLRH